MSTTTQTRNHPRFKVADLFCGAGGSTSGVVQALDELGMDYELICINHWLPAIETHKANHPTATHLCSSLDNVDPRTLVPDGRLNLLWASPECTHHSVARGGRPMNDQSRASAFHILRWCEALYIDAVVIENVKEFCFPPETTVLTKRGIVPIGTLSVGDEVWTHNARWKPVTRVARRHAPTVRLTGYGNSIVEPTPDHRFYARPYGVEIATHETPGRSQRRLLEPEWITAGQLVNTTENPGYAWATPRALPRSRSHMPKTLGVNTESSAFFYMLGRWLGNESVNGQSENCTTLVQISASTAHSPKLARKLRATGLPWRRYRHTASVDTFALPTAPSRILGRWLRANFGTYAHGMTLPAWIYGTSVRQRRALLAGYCDVNGHPRPDGFIVTHSISRCLAVAIRLLVQSLGTPASISMVPTTRDVVNGQTIQKGAQYAVTWQPRNAFSKAHQSDFHFWGPVQAVTPSRKRTTVVSIQVADDESFIADGQVVHNCTWGPLGVNGRPIKAKRGETLHTFLASLRSLGYTVRICEKIARKC